jgi:two-component system response regulator HydG
MILIVDDELENRETLRAVLEREGHACVEADSGAAALALLRECPEIRLLITDLKMPGMDGLELLQAARIQRPDVQRLLVTAFGTIEDTVAAMRSGAFDVLPKPLKARVIRETVQRLLERASPAAARPASQVSPVYARVCETVRRAATSEASVLFTGESGTGKSFLARLLHESSSRKPGPFVSLNCAAIPVDLLESELFGFEKGAFTGATQARDGKILAADGGTLLLDEIGDLSPALQAKLLQFIQTRRFFKLGSNREVMADVRILAATNRPLNELVAQGKFREDLLYRLKVVEIAVPPLRERKQDLLWLVPGLLDQLAEKNKRPPVRLTQAALSRLWNYDWPGNIRELENVLESALVLAAPEDIQGGFLDEGSLPAPLAQGPAGEMPVLADLETLERQALQQALALVGGNKRLAAGLLGISERSVYRLLELKDG